VAAAAVEDLFPRGRGVAVTPRGLGVDGEDGHRDGEVRARDEAPGRGVAGTVSRDQVRDIATKKLKDLNAVDVDAAMRMVEGSARSMGLQVVD